MKESLQSDSTKNDTEQLLAPKGIGMVVAFDWGLTVKPANDTVAPGYGGLHCGALLVALL